MTPAQKTWLDGEGRRLGYRIVGAAGLRPPPPGEKAVSPEATMTALGSGYADVRWITTGGAASLTPTSPSDIQVGRRSA